MQSDGLRDSVSFLSSVRTDLGFRDVRPRGFNVQHWKENGKGFAAASAFRSSNCSFSGVYCPSLRRRGGAICQIQFQRQSHHNHMRNTCHQTYVRHDLSFLAKCPKVVAYPKRFWHSTSGNDLNRVPTLNDVRLGNQGGSHTTFCERLKLVSLPSLSMKGGLVDALSFAGWSRNGKTRIQLFNGSLGGSGSLGVL